MYPIDPVLIGMLEALYSVSVGFFAAAHFYFFSLELSQLQDILSGDLEIDLFPFLYPAIGAEQPVGVDL